MQLFTSHLSGGWICVWPCPSLGCYHRGKVFQRLWMTLHVVLRLAQVERFQLNRLPRQSLLDPERGTRRGSWQQRVSSQSRCCAGGSCLLLWSPEAWLRFCSQTEIIWLWFDVFQHPLSPVKSWHPTWAQVRCSCWAECRLVPFWVRARAATLLWTCRTLPPSLPSSAPAPLVVVDYRSTRRHTWVNTRRVQTLRLSVREGLSALLLWKQFSSVFKGAFNVSIKGMI